MRTLKRGFSTREDKAIFNLRHAMFCLTGIKCEELCNQAILHARDQETRAYIYTYWLETSRKWAMYASSIATSDDCQLLGGPSRGVVVKKGGCCKAR